MAVIQSDGKIIVKKKEGDKSSIYHFDNVEDLVNKINQYNPETKKYGFVPSNCDLSGVDFSGQEFKSQEIDSYTGDYAIYDFSGSDLSNCNFNNCKNTWTGKFENTILDNAKMLECSLEGVSLNGSKGKNTNFKNVDFNDAELEGCSFECADFEGAYFFDARLNDSKFISCNLKVHKNSGRSGLRRSDISGSEVNAALCQFYVPELKIDNIKGDAEAVQMLEQRVDETTKEYTEKQKQSDIDRANPQYSAAFNIFGLSSGRF